jgi:hypothetical protein
VENNHGGTLQQAELIDISLSGARLYSHQKIPVRASVCFFHERLGIGGRGIARHCTSARRGYEIGLEFAGGTGWKPLGESASLLTRDARGFQARRPESANS